MISGRTGLACVIGHPVRHSLSPVLMNTAFASAGLDLVYTAFEVAPGAADQALDAMRTLGISGMNVTMPHKQQVFASVDELDPAAVALGAVNCVAPIGNGRLRGHNTDGAGFVDSLRLDADFDPAGRSTVVLGAGGAARAIVDALARAGAARVVVVNRTESSAHEAARLAGSVGSVGGLAEVAAAELVVNATSVGMGTAELPIDADVLHAGQLVADIVYHPLITALLGQARSRGAATLDGLGMLVHQAARAVELWTGTRPDHRAMRAAAEAELAARAAAS